MSITFSKIESAMLLRLIDKHMDSFKALSHGIMNSHHIDAMTDKLKRSAQNATDRKKRIPVDKQRIGRPPKFKPGTTIGYYFVVGESETLGKENYNVICKCGEIYTVSKDDLYQHRLPECKSEKHRYSRVPHNIAGNKFGLLTASHPIRRHAQGWTWVCFCECGSETEVRIKDLTNGNTLSCGCNRGQHAKMPAESRWILKPRKR